MLNQHKFHSYGFERGRWKSTQTISFACSSSSCSTPGELTSMKRWPSAELSSCPRLCCSFICRFSFSNSSKESVDKKKTHKRMSRCHKAFQPSMLEVPFSILHLQVVFPIFALQFLTQVLQSPSHRFFVLGNRSLELCLQTRGHLKTTQVIEATQHGIVLFAPPTLLLLPVLFQGPLEAP